MQAVRLIPVAGSKMYGRNGIFLHPFMLGDKRLVERLRFVQGLSGVPQSLSARGVTRMVVEQLEDPPGGKTAADWFSSAEKDFRIVLALGDTGAADRSGRNSTDRILRLAPANEPLHQRPTNRDAPVTERTQRLVVLVAPPFGRAVVRSHHQLPFAPNR